MIFIVLTILFTILLFVIFRQFTIQKIDTFQAITINYLIAAILSFLFSDLSIAKNPSLDFTLLKYAMLLGVYFIIMFNVMAKTTQKLGVSISSLASKMSLVIPVVVGVIFQNEYLSNLEVVAIVIALLSIYLTISSKNKTKGPIYLAVILFFGAGILDASLSAIEFEYLKTTQSKSLFMIIIFLFAFITGSMVMIVKRKKWIFKNIKAGIILGIPNYFSIYFLLKSLQSYDTSLVFPVLNISVVLCSALVGWKIYNEDLSKTKILGLILACISILILIYS
ncbi:MAG: EamA family transporter [Flavobacteriales bacterium]